MIRWQVVLGVVACVVLGGTACSSSSSSGEEAMDLALPPEGGPSPRVCRKFYEVADASWGAATLHRGTWRTQIVSAPSQAPLGLIELTWTYWIAGQQTFLSEACTEVQGVPPYLTVALELHALEMAPPGEQVHILLHLFGRLVGPARVKDGKRLAHPETALERQILVRATGVEVRVKDDPGRDFVLRTPQGAISLATKDQDARVEAAE